ARRRVTLDVHTSFRAGLYLQSECGTVAAEVSCCNLATQHGVSRIDTVLDPGTYFVVVDSVDTRRGQFTLAAESSDAPEIARLCNQLPTVTPGTTLRGDTTGHPDLMRGACSVSHFP